MEQFYPDVILFLEGFRQTSEVIFAVSLYVDVTYPGLKYWTWTSLLWALAITSFGSIPARAAVVAHYRFEDGLPRRTAEQVVDSSTNRLDGLSAGTRSLLFSSEVPNLPGIGKVSLNALGDHNFIRVPHDDRLVLHGDWTVEVMIKVHKPHGSFGGAIGDPELYTIAAKQNNSGFGRYLAAWSINFGPKYGRIVADLGFGRDAGLPIESATRVDDDRWHHIALAVARDVQGPIDRVALYIDGTLEALKFQAMPEFFYGREPLYIGGGNFGNDPNGLGDFRRNFDGFIDELRVTDAALAPPQFLSPGPDGPAIIQPIRLEIARTGSEIWLNWHSQVGKSYQLQTIGPSLQSWVSQGSPLRGTGEKIAIAIENLPGSSQLFRVLTSNY